ncbi:hypothetical protein [Sinimarinibacterium sp. NLF-5-8]|uniref:hypothetical protein n=1 Tax=Sinimarinibacterium sp. NLF-5-8 TaxID=2698684 RepID=UPI00137B9D4A|nr:hypothetical protein [Sinimarinibacterium sp. NLF-5-8]QHS09071.1 hypothetical protein GT972_02185 [Sinimarinibacterium sp. NLF-5-8]
MSNASNSFATEIRFSPELLSSPATWLAVADRAQCSVPEVIAVHTLLLTQVHRRGSRRGTIRGLDVAAFSQHLMMAQDRVQQILDAMQGSILDGDEVIGWRKLHAPPSLSTPRVQLFRRKKKQQTAGVCSPAVVASPPEGVADAVPIEPLPEARPARSLQARGALTPSAAPVADEVEVEVIAESFEDAGQPGHALVSQKAQPRAPRDYAGQKQALKAQVIEVFTFWKKVHKKPYAQLGGDRGQRYKLIENRLKSQYTVDELKQAILGCRLSAFHQGANEARVPYNQIGHILGKQDILEQFIQLHQEGLCQYHSPRNAHSHLRLMTGLGCDVTRPAKKAAYDAENKKPKTPGGDGWDGMMDRRQHGAAFR